MDEPLRTIAKFWVIWMVLGGFLFIIYPRAGITWMVGSSIGAAGLWWLER